MRFGGNPENASGKGARNQTQATLISGMRCLKAQKMHLARVQYQFRVLDLGFGVQGAVPAFKPKLAVRAKR